MNDNYGSGRLTVANGDICLIFRANGETVAMLPPDSDIESATGLHRDFAMRLREALDTGLFMAALTTTIALLSEGGEYGNMGNA